VSVATIVSSLLRRALQMIGRQHFCISVSLVPASSQELYKVAAVLPQDKIIQQLEVEDNYMKTCLNQLKYKIGSSIGTLEAES
jgi:hypothetical protein